MVSILNGFFKGTRKLMVFLVFILLQYTCMAQGVENRGCPNSYFRNNGNGQAVSVFAANITPGSIYLQSALTSGSQGNFTFKWGVNIVNPPVINKTWLTSTNGVITQNWVFGNNISGSPFNPPGVPDLGDVKYTFYNNNLPTAGTITVEFTDPFDGSYVNTCSYPLTSGSSSVGNLTSLAVTAPTNFSYSISSSTVINGSSGSSVAPTINSGGGTVTYSLQSSTNGITVNANTGIISWSSSTEPGVYNLTIVASNGIQPDATASYTLTVAESGVSSGNNGGLESKSLGDAVAVRVFNNAVQNIPSRVNYSSLEVLPLDATSRIYSMDIRQLMPDQQAMGSGITGFITSPVDILTFTNAVDVVSVDYVEGGLNKAVAFCTKTYNGIYTHTKVVCDRLKGSELLAVDTISRGQYTFLLYQLKPATGLKEYAISFSAGFNRNDSRYTLQSEWTTDRYAAQDTMFNFQLWSADVSILNIMLNNVLQKLINNMPVSQVGPVKKPVTYITKAERDGDNQLNLQLTINNSTSSTAGTIIISGKANEQATAASIFNYPVSFKANGKSIINIPIKDMAEAEIRLMVNGNYEDFVYSNDGIWNLYKTSATQLTSFTISNDTVQPKATEYRLFRNVKLIATTPDYVTVYRMVKGGGMAADLSQYNYLKFTATGSGSVRIRLVKKSISNYNEQYEYILPMQNVEKEYSIRLNNFTSSASTTPLKMNDILIVSFTWEATGSSVNINSSLSNVRFAKNATDVTVNSATLKVFPNPATRNTNLSFESAATEAMNLQLINIASGQIVMQKVISVNKGTNNINMVMPGNIEDGVYVIKMVSAAQLLQTKILKAN